MKMLPQGPGNQTELRIPIDHESFYEGRLFGELDSKASVHMEVLEFDGSSIYELFSCRNDYGIFSTTTLYPGGIRSHDPYLQSPRWQAETIPLDHAARAKTVMLFKFVSSNFFHSIKIIFCLCTKSNKSLRRKYLVTYVCIPQC
jgi:hypothetical protein